MVRRIAVFFIGPLIWFLGYGVLAMSGILLFDIDTDSYFAIGFLTYISSVVATYSSMLGMKKIHTDINETMTLILLSTFVFIWVGSTVVSAIYFGLSEESIFRTISLVMAEIGVLTGWKLFVAPN
jgi:hypothetical protein